MSQQLRTSQQQAVVNRLVERFGIDGRKVLFLNDQDREEPWLRAKTLAAIARQSGLFKTIEVRFDRHIPGLEQVVHQGTVTDLDDHGYSLPGVATIGEKAVATEEEINEHDLAESRALRSTLELAGFDPFDPTSVVSLGEFNLSGPRDIAAAKAESRLADLARIHILAKERFLIVAGAGPGGKDDDSGYRNFLSANYNGVRTAVGFDPLQRKSLIEALERYEVDEFAELAKADEGKAN